MCCNLAITSLKVEHYLSYKHEKTFSANKLYERLKIKLYFSLNKKKYLTKSLD